MDLRKVLKLENILGDGRELMIETQAGCYEFIIDGKGIVLDYLDILEMVNFLGVKEKA